MKPFSSIDLILNSDFLRFRIVSQWYMNKCVILTLVFSLSYHFCANFLMQNSSDLWRKKRNPLNRKSGRQNNKYVNNKQPKRQTANILPPSAIHINLWPHIINIFIRFTQSKFNLFVSILSITMLVALCARTLSKIV